MSIICDANTLSHEKFVPLHLEKYKNWMTKEELLSRLNGEEWNDFEVKEAKNEIPKNA